MIHPEPRRPHIIVLGNEKGGSGKSTTALHVIVALLRRGFAVGCIDLDARQGTLTRAVENRRVFMEQARTRLDLPEHRAVHRSDAQLRSLAEAEEAEGLEAALRELNHCDFVVIDTPGSDNFLSRSGHARANTLITPLNDSFLDLDVLARVDVQGRTILGPSSYSQMVWEQRQERARAKLPALDWIVMRNRLSHVDARNKRDIGRLIDHLAKRIHFRLAPGFGERVIFRELFPRGLTLLDLRDELPGFRMSISHVAARQEVRALLSAIGLADGPDEIADEQRDLLADLPDLGNGDSGFDAGRSASGSG